MGSKIPKFRSAILRVVGLKRAVHRSVLAALLRPTAAFSNRSAPGHASSPSVSTNPPAHRRKHPRSRRPRPRRAERASARAGRHCAAAHRQPRAVRWPVRPRRLRCGPDLPPSPLTTAAALRGLPRRCRRSHRALGDCRSVIDARGGTSARKGRRPARDGPPALATGTAHSAPSESAECSCGPAGWSASRSARSVVAAAVSGAGSRSRGVALAPPSTRGGRARVAAPCRFPCRTTRKRGPARRPARPAREIAGGGRRRLIRLQPLM